MVCYDFRNEQLGGGRLAIRACLAEAELDGIFPPGAMKAVGEEPLDVVKQTVRTMRKCKRLQKIQDMGSKFKP